MKEFMVINSSDLLLQISALNDCTLSGHSSDEKALPLIHLRTFAFFAAISAKISSHFRQVLQGFPYGFFLVFEIFQFTGKVAVVRAHIKMAVTGEIEQ